METLHATCVMIDGKGVVISGPSGSGKSDLALRLIDQGAALVADDVVVLSNAGNGVIARLPESGKNYAGLLEVRGLGLVKVPYEYEAVVDLVVRLNSSETIERLPSSRTMTISGKQIKALQLSPFEASAPAKIRAALTYELVS